MGRARGRKRQAYDNKGPLQRIYDRDHANDDTPIDATPERLAKEAASTLEEVKGEGHGRRVHKTRRIASSAQIDRLHRAGVITEPQYQAADWYRTAHYSSFRQTGLVAAYGERTAVGDIDYGLPRDVRQVDWRARFRTARASMPDMLVGFVDRLVLHDDYPRFRGRARMKTLAELRLALDALAKHLCLTPGTEYAQKTNNG